MATFLRTQSLGTTVTRQNLYDLINTCSFVNLGISISGVGALVAASSSPTQFTATTWWWDQTDQLLRIPLARVGNSACSLWLSIGPDSWELPVYNPGPNTIARGSFVSFKTGAAGLYDVEPTEPGLNSSPTYSNRIEAVRLNPNLRNCLGALQCTLASGEWGRVVYRGFGHVRYLMDNAALVYAYPMVLATAYTGVVQYDVSTYHTTPFCVGTTLFNPGITAAEPILTPAFIWMPFNTLTDTGKAG